MQLDKLGFVILHYQTLQDTYKCISSIFDMIDILEYEIIVVDNASPNHSGDVLEKQYRNVKKVTILINKENLGFSKGNNIGIDYARKNLDCNFIVVMNNDTYLIQDNFYQVIAEEYRESQFAVLGPRIYTNAKVADQSPMHLQLYTKDEIHWERKKLILDYYHLTWVLKFNEWMLNCFCKRKVEQIRKKEKRTFMNYMKTQMKRCEGVALHGCCIILSPVFFALFSGLNTDTFMYCEEYILYHQIMYADKKIVYNPKLKIFHQQMSSTKTIYQSDKKAERFRCRHCIHSLKVFEQMLDQHNKDIKKTSDLHSNFTR